MDTSSGSTFSPGLALLLAVLALVVPAIVAITVAVIGRGGKSKAVALDPDVVIPRHEYDRLVDVCADLSEEVDRKTRESDRLREQVDMWRGRSIDLGWKSP